MGKTYDYTQFQMLSKERIDELIKDKINSKILEQLKFRPYTAKELERNFVVSLKTVMEHLDALANIQVIGRLINNKTNKRTLKKIFKINWKTGSHLYYYYTPTTHRITKLIDIYYFELRKFFSKKTDENFLKMREMLQKIFGLLELVRAYYIHKMQFDKYKLPPKNKFKLEINPGKKFKTNSVFEIFLEAWIDDPYMRRILFDANNDELLFTVDFDKKEFQLDKIAEFLYVLSKEIINYLQPEKLINRVREDFSYLP